MSRPRTVTITAAVQSLYAFLITCTAVYCFLLAARMRKSADPHVTPFAREMVIGGCFVAVIASLYIAAAYGFWRSRRWAWWLALLLNAAVVTAVAYDSIAGDRDPDNQIAIAAFAIPVVFLLVPGVRAYFRPNVKRA